MARPITEDILPAEGTEEVEVARSWRILILALVLGAVLSAFAVVLLGTNQVGQFRAGSENALGLLLDQARKEERGLFEELSTLGADPAELRERYDRWLAGDRSGLRPEQVAPILRELHALRDRLEPISGSHLSATYQSAGQRIGRLDKSLAAWSAAFALWSDSVVTPHGGVVVAMGLERGPPPP